MIQANAGIGDAEFQSAEGGQEGLKQYLVGVSLLLKAKTSHETLLVLLANSPA